MLSIAKHGYRVITCRESYSADVALDRYSAVTLLSQAPERRFKGSASADEESNCNVPRLQGKRPSAEKAGKGHAE